MRTTPNEYELSGLSNPTGMEQVMPGVCPSQPLLAPVTSGGLTHPLQWVLRPRLGTPPLTYWHHTGLEREIFLYSMTSLFLRVHCNKQLIVICVETPSSGGGGVHHGRDRRRRQAAQDKEEVLDISEYNNLLKFLDSE